MNPTLILLAAYLLGSIPFGLLLTGLAGHGDIRKIGSGNIGATNVLRTGDKKLAVLTLLCDGLKGALAVWLAAAATSDTSLVGYAGFAALMGHMFPLWLGFKGGKGVATMLGVMLALCWPVSVMAMLVWLTAALMLRISSLSALVSIGTVPVFATIWGYEPFLSVLVLMTLFVFIKHNANIARLFLGTEPMIGEKKNRDESKTA